MSGPMYAREAVWGRRVALPPMVCGGIGRVWAVL